MGELYISDERPGLIRMLLSFLNHASNNGRVRLEYLKLSSEPLIDSYTLS